MSAFFRGLLPCFLLFSLGLAAAGCVPSAEGELNVLVPEYFENGMDGYGRNLSSPGRGTHLTQFEIIHQTQEMNYAQIRFEALALTYLEPVYQTHCQNLAESRFRCLGTGSDRGGFASIRFVSLLEGHQILGFQIWSLSPSPKLLADFGQGSDFVPRR